MDLTNELKQSIQDGGIQTTQDMICQNDGSILMLMEDVRMDSKGTPTGGVCPMCGRIQFFELPQTGITYKSTDYCPEIAASFTN